MTDTILLAILTVLILESSIVKGLITKLWGWNKLVKFRKNPRKYIYKKISRIKDSTKRLFNIGRKD